MQHMWLNVQNLFMPELEKWGTGAECGQEDLITKELLFQLDLKGISRILREIKWE